MSIIEDALEKARKEAELAPASPGGQAGGAHGNTVRAPEQNRKDAARTLDSSAQTTTATERAKARVNPLFPPSHLAAACSRPGFMGEEYRLLKERLLSLSRSKDSSGNRMNLFMITSPMRNEGKTLISCNLAMSLAYDFDHTVLLIDADLRAPSCHHQLGLPRSHGLVDCLTSDVNFQDTLVHTGIGKLSFLPAGKGLINPSELFSSNKMRELLREVKHRYQDRFIIIDTSPLLPFSESRALSRIVDGVILVARENVTLKAHFAAALQSLEGSNVLGVVYNDTERFGADKEVFNLCYSY